MARQIKIRAEVPVKCKFDEMVSLSKLKPHPKNRNKHPDAQIQRLAEILKYQGFRMPVRVSLLSGFVTGGHGRIEAARVNGWDRVPVNFQEYESEEQEYADLVADNAIALWAELDLKSIGEDVLPFGPDFDVNLLGLEDFTLDPSEQYDGDPDAVPDIAKEAKTKRGELWALGRHRLLIDDCTDPKNVARLMDGKQAAIWQSDPPYGISHVDVANEKGQAKGYAKIANDELRDEELKEFILKAITASLPHMKKGFAFYMWHAMKMQAYFSQAAAAAAAAGILFHRQIIWVKPQFVFGRGQYHWRHELCLMGWLQGDEPPFYGERNQSTVWEITRENDKIHPTQKPVAIWEAPLLNHTKPGDISYEPFAGSGSQVISCEMQGRICAAMELEPVYADVILQRWAKFTGKDPVREDGTTWSSMNG